MQKPLDTKQNIENEDGLISLSDVSKFIQVNWKIITVSLTLSVTASIIYILSSSPLYEAIGQVRMSQVDMVILSNDSRSTLAVKNIEESALLVNRFSSPSVYTSEVFAACKLEKKVGILDVIKVTPNKTIPSLVDLTTVGSSPKNAFDCAAAVFELMKSTQTQLIDQYITQTKHQLSDNTRRLDGLREQLIRAEKNSQTATATYLSTRDEFQYLLNERSMLETIVNSRRIRLISLITPIYVSEIPISPNKRFTLMVGMFGGFFLGIFLALAIKAKNKRKIYNQF
jgi:uncharacterized protein involved in exopolysaccharide biosynthesis